MVVDPTFVTFPLTLTPQAYNPVAQFFYPTAKLFDKVAAALVAKAALALAF